MINFKDISGIKERQSISDGTGVSRTEDKEPDSPKLNFDLMSSDLEAIQVFAKSFHKETYSSKASIETDNEELSLRYNDNKLPIHLVPPSAIKAMAGVLEYGKNKYAERNWEKGHMYSVPYASLMRHLLAFWQGENNDPESGLPHLHHVIMNAAMLVEYSEMNKPFDDRPKRGN